MIPVKLLWDTRRRSILVRWNRLVSFEWGGGRPSIKVLCIRKSLKPGRREIPGRFRLAHLRETLSFLSKWKLDRVEGTISLPDPMLNGMLYGWLDTFNQNSPKRRFNVTINFLGENWIAGEASISPWAWFRYLRKFMPFPRFKREKRRRG